MHRLRAVRQVVPLRQKTIYVSGWEPLGNVCNTDTAKSRATPYCSIEKPENEQCNQGQWHGTWGYHFHTWYNLILRSEARWCRFSSDWQSYDYMKFLGGTVWIPQMEDLCLMFNADPYLLSSHFAGKENKEATKEETWIHPGYLLHAPGTHLIMNRRLHHQTRFYKIKIKVPTAWDSWAPIKGVRDWITWFWVWTWWDPQRAFFDPCADLSKGACAAEPWWGQANYLDKWVDRSQYETTGGNQQKTWGPFLPPKNCSGQETSFWFKYKLKFKVGGESLWAPVPRDPIEQGYIPGAPGLGARRPAGEIQPHSRAFGGQTIPRTPHDILPGDLAGGILHDEALERITRRDEETGESGEPPRKRVKLGPPGHLPRDLNRVLLRILRRRIMAGTGD